MPPAETQSVPILTVQGRPIGLRYPTYFIADIGANHNGSIEKAKDLICLAKEAGADAAKFQHFRAEKIVSQYGFESLSDQRSHQAGWEKPVFEVYRDASVPWEWTAKIKSCCDKAGIHFFSAPYDFESIDMLDAYMPAYKIGSGDINWHESLERIAAKQKPVFLATGASTMEEVETAVRLITAINPRLCVMQCNTNYTGSQENFNFIQLNVLKSFSREFPNVVLGLSDHTPGHTTVLGAVALGARAVEKHFTDNRNQQGPDHPFSMDPKDWWEMVERVRELELALGGEEKKVEGNEQETVLIQRRCLRAARNLEPGETLRREDIAVLRPAKVGALPPSDIQKVVGRTVKKRVPKEEALGWEMFDV